MNTPNTPKCRICLGGAVAIAGRHPMCQRHLDAGLAQAARQGKLDTVRAAVRTLDGRAWKGDCTHAIVRRESVPGSVFQYVCVACGLIR